MLPTALIVLTGVATAFAAAGSPGASLSQLPGTAGCLKGSAGKTYRPCERTVLGQYDVSSVAISPDGRFAYGASLYSGTGPDGDLVPGGTVVAFARDRQSGALTQLSGDAGCIKDRQAPANDVTNPCAVRASGLRGAKTIVLSPDGRFAYVAALEDDAIAAFRRDPVSGRLTQLAGSGACIQDREVRRAECPVKGRGLHGIRWIEPSPDGRNLYASAPANDAIAAFRINARTGALTQLRGAGACIEDRLARLKGSCPTTGPGLNYPRTITVSPDGRNAYVASDTADSSIPDDAAAGDAVAIFRRDPRTGALTQLPGKDACIKDVLASSITRCSTVGRGLLDAFHVAVSPDGRHVYVGANASKRGAIAVFERDRASGALEQPAGADGCLGNSAGCAPARGIGGVDAITISHDGRHAWAVGYFSNSVAAFNRNTRTGKLSQVRGRHACIQDIRSTAGCPQTIEGIDGPRILTLSPDGRHAYVASSNGGAITTYRVSYPPLTARSRRAAPRSADRPHARQRPGA